MKFVNWHSFAEFKGGAKIVLKKTPPVKLQCMDRVAEDGCNLECSTKFSAKLLVNENIKKWYLG